jgi:hypothetical protein
MATEANHEINASGGKHEQLEKVLDMLIYPPLKDVLTF